jgi:hypothetical protein
MGKATNPIYIGDVEFSDFSAVVPDLDLTF